MRGRAARARHRAGASGAGPSRAPPACHRAGPPRVAAHVHTLALHTATVYCEGTAATTTTTATATRRDDENTAVIRLQQTARRRDRETTRYAATDDYDARRLLRTQLRGFDTNATI